MLHAILEEEARSGGGGGSADWYWNYMNYGAGAGRLRPDQRGGNNIGRYITNPGPVGFTTDDDGNTQTLYQDPITGGYYYEQKTFHGTETFETEEYIEGYSVNGVPGLIKNSGTRAVFIYGRVYVDPASNSEQKDPLLEFVGFNHGIPQFESRLMPGVSGVTPGPFIIYSSGASKKKSLNTHEPGHVVQFFLLRGYKLYIPLIAIPSLITVNKPYHNEMPWEKSANQLWYWLTGENHPSNPLYFDKRKKKR